MKKSTVVAIVAFTSLFVSSCHRTKDARELTKIDSARRMDSLRRADSVRLVRIVRGNSIYERLTLLNLREQIDTLSPSHLGDLTFFLGSRYPDCLYKPDSQNRLVLNVKLDSVLDNLPDSVEVFQVPLMSPKDRTIASVDVIPEIKIHSQLITLLNKLKQDLPKKPSTTDGVRLNRKYRRRVTSYIGTCFRISTNDIDAVRTYIINNKMGTDGKRFIKKFNTLVSYHNNLIAQIVKNLKELPSLKDSPIGWGQTYDVSFKELFRQKDLLIDSLTLAANLHAMKKSQSIFHFASFQSGSSSPLDNIKTEVGIFKDFAEAVEGILKYLGERSDKRKSNEIKGFSSYIDSFTIPEGDKLTSD